MPPTAIPTDSITHHLYKGKRNGGIFIAYVKKTNNPRMGRPAKDRSVGVNIKISPAEYSLLDEIVRRTGKSKTDVIVKGIALLYKELNK